MLWTETHTFLSSLRGFLTVEPISIELHETGLVLAERYGLSVYDAMIAASSLPHAEYRDFVDQAVYAACRRCCHRGRMVRFQSPVITPADSQTLALTL
jgi:hypothetical protein